MQALIVVVNIGSVPPPVIYFMFAAYIGAARSSNSVKDQAHHTDITPHCIL